MNEKTDYILNECCLTELVNFVKNHEKEFNIRILKKPSLSLTMIRAEDTVEQQEFYLGEALTSDCEVEIDGQTGIGITLGDNPQRAYCIAVFDAVLQNNPQESSFTSFIDQQSEKVNLKKKIEYNQVQRTRVDFKMMEQA